MESTAINQWINLKEDYLLVWIDAFLKDRQAQNLSRGTIEFYRKKLRGFTTFCEAQAVTQISQITPSLIRDFLLSLEEKKHNSGGIHSYYRSLKSFLRWFENEVEPEDWKNPINKVKPPKLNKEILDPVNIDDVQKMLSTCTNDFLGRRDKAIILFLLDTGVRASELLSISLKEINPIMGDVVIRLGKGGKSRVVYLGVKARKAVRAYLRLRDDNSPFLFVTDDGEHLTYWGLKMMMRRRAILANVKTPQVHAFRRWFALNSLRLGMPLYSLKTLMGHSDLQVLERYLKLVESDVKEAHQKYSPLDNI